MQAMKYLFHGMRLLFAGIALTALVVFICMPRIAMAADGNPDEIPSTSKGSSGIKTLQTITVYPSPGFSGAFSGVISFGGGSGGSVSHGDIRLYTDNNSQTTTKKKKDRNGCADHSGDPIEVSTQARTETLKLFSVPGEMGLTFNFYYTSPTGWEDSLSYYLDVYCIGKGHPILQPPPPGSPGGPRPVINAEAESSCNYITYYRPDGSSIRFSGYPGRVGTYAETGGGGLATLIGNADGSYTLHDEDGATQTYSAYGTLLSIKDESGIGWTITTDSSGRPVKVTHTDGQSYTLAYTVDSITDDTETDTVKVTDPAGNVYQFTETEFSATEFPALGPYQISSVTFPGSPATTITYQYTTSTPTAGTVLLSGTAINGVAYSTATYNNGRASSTRLADGSQATSISYAFPTYTTMVATVTNPLGHISTMTYGSMYDDQFLLTSVSDNAVADCGATTHTMAYDSNGDLTKTVDNDGITHTYSYAANGQLQSDTAASGTSVARKTDYTWDANPQLNRVASVTIEDETRTNYVYNAQNRLASSTATNLTSIGTPNQSLTTAYTYTLYSNGMVHTTTVTAPSPDGSDHATYVYDTHGNLTSATDGLGHATTYSGYNALGEVGKVVGPNGAETDYTYDARGRVATKTTHPNGTAATWTYAYDGFGLLAGVTAPDGEVTTWTRDAEKRVKTITHNDKDGASTETFGYDAGGNVISDVIARGGDIGKSTAYVYNALGEVYQVKGSHGQVLTYAYDGNGNVLSVTDALGHKNSYAYDALNRVVSKTDAEGGVTHYSYDNGDHVASVTDPRGLVTTYSYDGLGQKWKQVSPDTGTTSFVYDADGRLASTTRADGTQTAYAYDALNRLTDASAGGASRQYLWDACTNGKGRLCAASSAGSNSVGFAYSPEGWVTAKSFVFSNGPSYSLGYSYNDLGALTKVLYPDGNSANYYYQDGAVYQVGMQVGSYYVFGPTNIDYAPMDLAMTDWTGYNGLANTIAYDSDGRPTAITSPGVEALSFSYDADNRITHIANGVDNTQSETLGYDALNRLTSVASTADTESYQYDADGNRTQQVVNGVTTAFTYTPGSNQLASASGGISATYGYDANGNTTTLDNHTAYQYGPFGRLSNAGGAGFVISAGGYRIAKLAGTGPVYFARDASGTLMAEDLGDVWRDYVWLNGRLVTVIANGGVFPVATDQAGRPLALTSPISHALAWTAAGLPFDRTVTYNAWGSFNLGFPGQYHDQEDGLWYNGQRDYDASLGRYIESDPIGLGGGVNTYAYVGDNPITGVDPLGLCDQKKCTQAAAVVAALGQALSSTGSGLTWAGVGITSASVLGAVFAPEGAELEVEGGIDGASMITAGSRLSALGGVLTGYAASGFAGAVENGLAAAVLDKFDEGVAGLALPEGTSEAATHAVAGVLGEASDAVLAEQAACVGH